MPVSGINPLAVGGLASGLDTNTIVDELMKATRKQGEYLYNKRDDIERRKEVLRDFNMQLMRLQNAAFDLRLDTIFKLKNTSSTNSSVVTAIADTGAATGSHQVKVTRLASAARAASCVFSPRVSNNPPNTAGITGIGGAQVATPANLYGAKAEDAANEGCIASAINSTNNRLSVTFGGTTVEVELAGAAAGITTMDEVAADAQNKINNALNQSLGTSNVTYVVVSRSSNAGADNDHFWFISNFDGSRHTLSVDTASSAAAALGFGDPTQVNARPGLDPAGGEHSLSFYEAAAARLQGTDLAPTVPIDFGAPGTYSGNIHLNGTDYTLNFGGVYDDLDQLAADIEAQIPGSVIHVANQGGQLVFSSHSGDNTMTITGSVCPLLGLTSGDTATGSNARVVDVFTPQSGTRQVFSLEDTTDENTDSNMANLLKRINGQAVDAGHTANGGVGPLIEGVTISAAGGLVQGSAVINTTRGNELSTQLATYATFTGGGDVGTTGITTYQTLEKAGFANPATTAANGVFTINGKQITISDYRTVTVNQVLAMINGSGAGVTATYDSTNNRFVLTANQKGGGQEIKLGAGTDTSNFLQIARLDTALEGEFTAGLDDGKVNPSVALVSSGISKNINTGTFSINGVSIFVDPAIDSLNDVMAKINNSAAGVTATYNATGDILELTSKDDKTGQDRITIGGATDTSNFWWAVNMAYPPLIEGSDDVLSVPIEVGSPGQGAVLEVDGRQYVRRSNEIDDIIEGVTLSLKGTSSSPATIDIVSNTEQAFNQVKAFIVQYNKTMELASPQPLTKDEREKQLPKLTEAQRKAMTAQEIDAYEKRQEELLKREVLRRDDIARNFYSTLRRAVSNIIPGLDSGYNSLAAIGINTGAWGSAPGANPHGMLVTTSTDEKVIEEFLRSNSVFMNALQENPDKVLELFGRLNQSTASVTGTVSVNGIVVDKDLSFSIGDGTKSAVITLPPKNYTASALANAINSSLTAAGITTVAATINAANQLRLVASTPEGATSGQAVLDLTDMSGGRLQSQLGIQPGLYRGDFVQSLTGLVRRVENETRNLTQSSGLLNNRIKEGGFLDQELYMVGDAIKAFESRMTAIEERLWKQFSALETFMNEKNTQSAWLAQQMASFTSYTQGAARK